MPNWCENDLYVRGSLEEINTFLEFAGKLIPPFVIRPLKRHNSSVFDAKITFSTAWAPPIPVIEAMGKKFPGLEFILKYFEGGMGFQGTFVVRDGVVVQNKNEKYTGHRGG